MNKYKNVKSQLEQSILCRPVWSSIDFKTGSNNAPLWSIWVKSFALNLHSMGETLHNNNNEIMVMDFDNPIKIHSKSIQNPLKIHSKSTPNPLKIHSRNPLKINSFMVIIILTFSSLMPYGVLLNQIGQFCSLILNL